MTPTPRPLAYLFRGRRRGQPGPEPEPGQDQVWSGQPNEALVREVADMTPGTALDVGCGEGADAIWLAGQGWAVDAVDVSTTALTRAEQAVAAITTDLRSVDVTWRHLGLADLPDDTAYDLVSVFYPAFERGDGTIVDTLLDAVAEGGTLLVAHHADVDPDDLVRHEDLLAALGPTDWTIEEAGEHPRTTPEGSGSHHTVDLILRASRKMSA